MAELVNQFKDLFHRISKTSAGKFVYILEIMNIFIK